MRLASATVCDGLIPVVGEEVEEAVVGDRWILP